MRNDELNNSQIINSHPMNDLFHRMRKCVLMMGKFGQNNLNFQNIFLSVKNGIVCLNARMKGFAGFNLECEPTTIHHSTHSTSNMARQTHSTVI